MVKAKAVIADKIWLQNNEMRSHFFFFILNVNATFHPKMVWFSNKCFVSLLCFALLSIANEIWMNFKDKATQVSSSYKEPNGNQIIKQLVRQKWHQDGEEWENHFCTMNAHIVYFFNLIRDRKKEIVYLDLVSFKGGERSEQVTAATMIVRRHFKRYKQKSRLNKPMCVWYFWFGLLLLDSMPLFIFISVCLIRDTLHSLSLTLY